MICERGENNENEDDKSNEIEEIDTSVIKPIQQLPITDEDLGLGKRKKSHNGCGSRQPVIRKDGLKLYVSYKNRDGDVRNIYTHSHTHIYMLSSIHLPDQKFFLSPR